MNSVPNLDVKLQFFRTCDPKELSQLISTVITDGRLPKEFLDSLNEEDRTICHRACMICWSVTDKACVQREMQLRVILAERHGFDALVASGTGSGKTLLMALTMLLEDPAEHRFNSFIPYLTQENIQHIATRTPGSAQHLIVTVEQLFKRSQAEGHFPRLAILMRQNQSSKRIARINIDEVHCIHTAGLPRYENCFLEFRGHYRTECMRD